MSAPSVPPPHEDPRVGVVVGGKYELRRCLGAGGMGVVYEARNTWTDAAVALKFIATRDGSDTLPIDVVERLFVEARAATRVTHPNAVRVIDVARDEDGLFLVQELLHGETLAERIARSGPLTLDEAREVLFPVMDALDAAHAADVVHRDVKPENIFLCRAEDGRITPKILDFGVALLRDDTRDARLTRSGSAVGTVAFMSPEQARGARDLDGRTDVWAMALVFIEALTGRRVVDGDGYNAVLAKVLTERPPAARALLPDAPETVCDALDAALRSDRATRTASLRALREGLSAGGRAAVAPRASAPRNVVMAVLALSLASVSVIALWSLRAPAQRSAATPAVIPRTTLAAPRVDPPPTPAPAHVLEPTPAPLPDASVIAAPPRALRRPARRDASVPTRTFNGAPILNL